MSLAKQLVEEGEFDVVLKYFDLVDVFWSDHGSFLDDWRATVRKGETPDFGANMVY